MPIISRVLAITRLFIRRHLWWAAALVFALLWLCVRGLYFAVLPEEGWLSRGWLALHNGRYPEAEACFLRAREKNTRDVLPRIALLTLYTHEQHADPPAVPPLALLDKLPGIGRYFHSVEQYWAEGRAKHCHHVAPSFYHWGEAQFTDILVTEQLFYDYWMFYPRELRECIAMMGMMEHGQDVQAWGVLSRIRQRNSAIFRTLLESQPKLFRYCALAAWHSGHLHEVEEIAHTAQASSVSGGEAIWAELLHNARLGLAQGIVARMWSVRDGQLHEGCVPTADRFGAALVLAPMHGNISLLVSPRPRQGDTQQWWQWVDGKWEQAAPEALHLLNDFFPERQRARPWLQQAWGTSSPSADYLALRKSNTPGRMSLLLRRDSQGITQIIGHAPFEILWLNGDLWVHEERGFSRSEADHTCTIFEGHAVSREGDLFAVPETLPPLPMALDDAWQLAKDGAGHLWLVSWDGRRLVLRATWTGATFRPPSAAEQQGAAAGFLDTSGRAWSTADLPHGFHGDDWRQASGLPKQTGPAAYAVDGKGRIWVICGGIIARWDGHWASVANHVPGLAVSTNSILAAGNGVLITFTPGDRVCYME